MKTKLILSVLFLFLGSACSTPDRLTGRGEHRKDYDIADQIQYKINQQLSKEGFFLYGSGGRYYPTIHHISNFYITTLHTYTSIDDVRSILCKIVEMNAIAFNNDKRIRPFLHNYPFTSKNINISISFCDKDRNPLKAPYITYAQCIEGIISYYAKDESGKRSLISKESYETAYSIYLQNREKANGN